MVKVSIIVAVYNVADYLEECFQSLLNQTLKQIEIIVVNDGSTDNTGVILKKYKKLYDRFSYIEISNAGLGAARNAGIREARGEYIGFIDGDDMAESIMYEYMYKKAKERDLDIVACLHNCFWDDGIKANYIYPEYPFKEPEKFFPRDCPEKFKAMLNFSACNKIFRRSLFRKFPEKIFHEDIPVAFDLFSSGYSVLCLNKPFHLYRQGRSGRITENSSTRRFDILNVSSSVEKMLHAKNLNRGWENFFLNWRNQYYLIIFKKIAPKYRKKYLALVSEDLQKNTGNVIQYLKKIKDRKLRSFFLFNNIRWALDCFRATDSVFFHTKKKIRDIWSKNG